MLFEDTYLSIAGKGYSEFRDRGSRFIAYAFRISSEQDVKNLLQQIKKEHPQAGHHCYAFRLTTDPGIFRASDDREPSGSAGKPILGAIQSKGVTDTLVIVVRYFGGTLLGVPGLINAYRTAAKQALDHAGTEELILKDTFEIEFAYELSNEVHQLFRLFPVNIKMQNYDNPCQLRFEIRKSAVGSLLNKIKEHPQLSHQSKITAIQHGTT